MTNWIPSEMYLHLRKTHVGLALLSALEELVADPKVNLPVALSVRIVHLFDAAVRGQIAANNTRSAPNNFCFTARRMAGYRALYTQGKVEIVLQDVDFRQIFDHRTIKEFVEYKKFLDADGEEDDSDDLDYRPRKRGRPAKKKPMAPKSKIAKNSDSIAVRLFSEPVSVLKVIAYDPLHREIWDEKTPKKCEAKKKGKKKTTATREGAAHRPRAREVLHNKCLWDVQGIGENTNCYLYFFDAQKTDEVKEKKRKEKEEQEEAKEEAKRAKEERQSPKAESSPTFDPRKDCTPLPGFSNNNFLHGSRGNKTPGKFYASDVKKSSFENKVGSWRKAGVKQTFPLTFSPKKKSPPKSTSKSQLVAGGSRDDL